MEHEETGGTVMFASPTRRGCRIGSLALGVVLLAFIPTACGDDDGAVTTQTQAVSTTQAAGGGDAGPEDAGGEGVSGGAGTATVIVSAGTFELEVEDACVISVVGIGVVASSDQGSMTIAGPAEIAVVGFELTSGEAWFAAAAEIVVDGNTMSYSGPAMNPNESDSTISVQVVCNDVVGGLEG
jgi:hypothetical protein